MDGNDWPRLLYLGVLAVAVGAAVVVQFRGRLGQAVQQAAIWGLILTGLVAAFGLWEDIQRDITRQATVTDGGAIEVPRSGDGHYHLTLRLNGTPVSFIVDTGATDMVLSRSDAARVGIDTEGLVFLGRAQTANGIVQTARVTLDTVELGPYSDADVPAQVTDGAMPGSLLGMRYLERFDRLEISGDRLTLQR